MMGRFEKIKRNFDGTTGRDFTVELRGVGSDDADSDDDDDDDMIIVKGYIFSRNGCCYEARPDLILTDRRRTALKAIFDNVCSKIDTLVANQVKQIKDKGIKIKVNFLDLFFAIQLSHIWDADSLLVI